MKFTLKRTLALTLSLTLALGIFALPAPAYSFAGDVSFNGKTVYLSDAMPVVENGSVYIPLRALADTMGADIGWEDSMVIFTYAGTTLKFNSGGAGSVTQNGATKNYTLSPAPKFINGRALVAGETLADVFGLVTSGWYNASVIDLDVLLKGLDGRFTVLNSLLDASLQSNDSIQKGSLTGTADVSVSMFAALFPNLSIPFELNHETTTVGMNSAGSFDFSADLGFIKTILPLLGLGDEVSMILEMLDGLSLSYILNSDDDIMYIHAPLANEMLGMDSDVWFTLDMGIAETEALGIDLDALINGLSVSSLTDLIIRSLATEMYLDYDMVTLVIDMLEAFMGDKAFSKTGTSDEPVYTLAMGMDDLMVLVVDMMAMMGEEVDLDEAWAEIEADFNEFDFGMKLVIAFGKDGSFKIDADYSVAAADDNFYMSMEMTGTSNTPGKSSLEILITAGDGKNADVSVTINFEGTIEKYSGAVASAPPAGTVTVDLTKLMGF
jgi:hypothetical protein